MQNQQKQAESKLRQLRKDEKLLNEELIKVLRGSSSLNRNTIQSLIDENHNEQKEVEAILRDCQNAASKENFRIKLLGNHLKDITNWSIQFDSMTIDKRRAVLHQMISRIEVTRGYNISILFNVSLEDFTGEHSEQKAGENLAVGH